MPFTVTFDRKIAGGLSSRKDSSEIPPLVAYCEDLTRCGPFTHQRSRVQGTFNTTGALCSPPFTGYQVSGSVLNRLDRADTGVGALLSNAAEALGILHAHIAVGIGAAIAGTPAPAPGFDPGISAWFRQGDWVQLDSTLNQVVRMSVVRVVDRIDNCGVVVGRKGTASLSFIQKNPVDCKPLLEIGASLNLYVTNDGALVPQTALAIDGLWNQSTMSLQTAALPDALAANCATMADTAFQITNGASIPAVVTLGA